MKITINIEVIVVVAVAKQTARPCLLIQIVHTIYSPTILCSQNITQTHKEYALRPCESLRAIRAPVNDKWFQRQRRRRCRRRLRRRHPRKLGYEINVDADNEDDDHDDDDDGGEVGRQLIASN